MSAAAEIVASALAAARVGQVGMGVIAAGGGLACVLQGPRFLVRVHLLPRDHRTVEGLQLVGHVVERLQAIDREVGAHHEQAAFRLGGLGQTLQRGPREGRQPRAALVEATLIADGPASAIEPELTGHRQARGPGLQFIGIPRLDVLQRNGMEREQEPIPRLFGKARVADGGGHGPDVGGILAVAVDKAHTALEPCAAHRLGHTVAHRAGGGKRRLRVHGQNDKLGAALLLQLLHRLLEGGLSVAHAGAHDDGQPLLGIVVVQAALQGSRNGNERRTFFGPDLLVLLRRGARALAQDGRMQQRPPHRARHGADARIHEELREVLLHGLSRGSLGRSRVRNDDAHLARGGGLLPTHRVPLLPRKGRATLP